MPHLYMFSSGKKYVFKAKSKDEDAEYTSVLDGEEHRENMNIVKTNIDIKVEEELTLLKKLKVSMMMC